MTGRSEEKRTPPRKRNDIPRTGSDEIFQSLFETVGSVIILLSPDHQILEFNREAERVFETAREEAIGKDYFKLFLPEGIWDVVAKDIEAVLSGIETRNFENKISSATGRERVVLWNVTRMLDPSGNPSGVIACGQDITERKRVEEALREEKERAQKYLDVAGVILLVIDASQNVSLVNKKGCELLGFEEDDILGKNWFDNFIPEAQRDTVQSAFHDLMEGKIEPAEYFENSILNSSGRERTIAWHNAVLTDQCGGVVGTLSSGEDVTDKKRAEGALRRAQEDLERKVRERTASLTAANTRLQREIVHRRKVETDLRIAKKASEVANRVKSAFLANISHEFSTPMNSILGYTELVLDEVDGPINEEQKESLGRVEKNARHLLGLLDRMIDLSRIESGKTELDAVAFSLRDLLREPMQALTVRATEKGLSFRCDVREDVPDAMVGDPGRLREIAIHLVENAIKFTEEGEVTVKIEKESDTEDRMLLHFTVTDTGIGILPEEKESIFEAFVQANNSATRRHNGAGLGLAISSRLLDMMGGRLWVDSEVGRGSTFHFTVGLSH